MKTKLAFAVVGILGATIAAGYAQPSITRQPTNLSLSIGATATFRVTAATMNPPLSYQWRHQDTPLLGATNASLTLSNIQMTNAGPYAVAVSDLRGEATNSAAAVLDVDPTWTKVTSDPIVTDHGYDFCTAQWADLDHDGFLDLFVVTDLPQHNPTYHNNGDGTFTRMFEPSLQAVKAVDLVYTWGDYDNDGHLDLFVPCGLNAGKNVLYHNDGAGTFTKITNSPITAEGFISSSGTWVDYDRDGDLDLFVPNGTTVGTKSLNWFYQNQGDGTFVKLTNGTVLPLINEPGQYDLAVWVDIDNDGWQDVFLVKTGNSANALYRNTGAGGFIKVTDDPLVRELDSHWGDAAWADYDNDGDLDVFLTTRPQDPSVTGPVALFRNDGLGHFTKMTASDIGPLANERATTYVCCWGDYDNDGWLDLYIANDWVGGAGRVDRLYHNNGDGTFTKVTRGSPVTELGASVGGNLVDLNNDGFLDLFTAKHPAPDNALARLYLNNGNSNNWLCVNCAGTVSPRLGTGTKVRVKATIRRKSMWQLRVIDPGGFANGQNFTAHFGLGDATNVDVLRLEWTSGIVQELKNVPAKQHLTVTEPAKLQMPRPGELSLQCWKGMPCCVEYSSDLATWTPLAWLTNLALTGGIRWSDPDAALHSARFYRVEPDASAHP